MYKEKFKIANDKVKMDEQLKETILDNMQSVADKERSHKTIQKKFSVGRMRTAAAVIALMIAVSGVSIYAINMELGSGLKQFFDDKIKKSGVKDSNVDLDNDNFLTDIQLENLGESVNLIKENDGMTVKITGLVADNYSLYGTLEIIAPKNIKFSSKHKEDELNAFTIGASIEPEIKIDNKTKNVEFDYDSATWSYYQLADDDEDDNIIKYAFCISTKSFEDVADNSNSNHSVNFEGKKLTVYDIWSYCECKDCNKVCKKVNKLLDNGNFELKLPDKIAKCREEIRVDKSYKVVADYSWDEKKKAEYEVEIKNIVITPFSIRYKQIGKTEGTIAAATSIIFEDGTEFKQIDPSELGSSEKENEKVCSGEFSKPINTNNVKAVIIGEKEISIK